MSAIASFMAERLGPRRAVLSVSVCMKSTPAQRRGFLLIGIGDTASRTRVLDL